jgi:phage baseplate assembly protein W
VYNTGHVHCGRKIAQTPLGSRVAAACDFGVDLTLLIERLRKTLEERVRDLQSAIDGPEKIRGKARRQSAAQPTADKPQEVT